MHQAHPGHPTDGSFAAVPDKDLNPLVRSILPPLSRVILGLVAAQDLAKQNPHMLDNEGDCDDSEGEDHLTS